MLRILIVLIAILLLSRIGATTEGEEMFPPQESSSPVLYSKGGTLLAFVSDGGSEALSDKLKEDQWVRDARNSEACYRLILKFDTKDGMYSLLGGPMRDRLLEYSSDLDKILEWLHALEELKCNRVSV